MNPDFARRQHLLSRRSKVGVGADGGRRVTPASSASSSRSGNCQWVNDDGRLAVDGVCFDGLGGWMNGVHLLPLIILSKSWISLKSVQRGVEGEYDYT